MGPETLAPEMFDGYDYLYVEGYLVQNHALILRAVELAKEKGMKVCLDLASYNIVAADHEFFTRLVTEYVDVVFANEEEARAFAQAEPAEALEHLHSLCEVAVVKLGPAGSTIMRQGEKVFVEAWPVAKVIDTTAAGDFYAAGVMYGLMNGCTLAQCAKVGTILSGHVIQIVGTQLAGETWNLILNFANCDMVGHTGKFDAAVAAVEAVDKCLGRVLAAIEKAGGAAIITADHGNADRMYDTDGSPFTAHTTNPVPLAVVGYPCKLREGGILADIAPTMLEMIGLEQPEEMTGKSLIEK